MELLLHAWAVMGLKYQGLSVPALSARPLGSTLHWTSLETVCPLW